MPIGDEPATVISGYGTFMKFLYRRPACPLDSICRQANLCCAVEIATELDGEWVMRARVVVQERRALLADWMSRKSMRAAVLLGVLLTISVAVNAMIIFTDASRP